MTNGLDAVVDVRVTRPGESVYGLFKECGTIKSIHSWNKPGERDVVHYFVVFADAASVPRAVGAPAVALAGATVTPVEGQAELAAAYVRTRPESGDWNTSPKASTSTSNTGAPAAMPPPPVPPARVSEPLVSGAAASAAATPRQPSAFLREVREHERASRPERTWTALEGLNHPSDLNGPPLPDFKPSNTSLEPIATGFPTSLELHHLGVSVHVDLACVDADNPRALIALLTKTDTERATWMLAGAHLRRSGHPASAYAVVSAMVEAMTKAGTPEEDLKPAFLFLSGCHTDLARRMDSNGAMTPSSEAGPSSTAFSLAPTTNHAAEAKRLLQKVYGTQRPEPPRPTISTTTRPQENGKGNNKRRPQGNVSELQILQREVQSLRDRNDHLTRQLRKAERAADDTHGELANERAARRRAESAAEMARRDVQSARRDQHAAEEARDEASRRLGEQAARMPMMSIPQGMPGPPLIMGMLQ